MRHAPGDFTELNVGDRVRLVHQPGNVYDANAILIMSEDCTTNYGYIKRADNTRLLPEIDRFEVTVDQFNYYMDIPKGFMLRLRDKATLDASEGDTEAQEPAAPVAPVAETPAATKPLRKVTPVTQEMLETVEAGKASSRRPWEK